MAEPTPSPAPRPGRDRVIADSGWGIKPDDQPSNTAEAGESAVRAFRYDPAAPPADVVRQILLAQRRAFNTANRVRIERDEKGGRTVIIDINKDSFLIDGLSFGDDTLTELLHALGAAFNPQELRRLKPTDHAAREYPLSRAWAWGAERAGG